MRHVYEVQLLAYSEAEQAVGRVEPRGWLLDVWFESLRAGKGVGGVRLIRRFLILGL